MRSAVLSLFLLAAAGATAVTASPSLAPILGPATGNVSGEQGTASGKWDLPGGGIPGHATGILIDAQGLPVYALKAALVPKLMTPTGGLAGELKGTLNQLAGPSVAPFALLRGHWKAGPLGFGEFRAVILDPGDPTQGIPPYPIGLIAGKFHDPHPPGVPGPFKAHWKLP